MGVNQLEDLKKVKFVKYFFVDINGKLREVEVNYDSKAGLQPILFDGSSIPGFGTINKSDCWLCPDESTFALDHLESTDDQKIAYVFCNVRTIKNEVHKSCTRSMLANLTNTYHKERNIIFNIGFEPEFFLFDKKAFYENGEVEPIDHGGYFTFAENPLSEKICREISVYLGKYNITLEKISHEVAQGQFEINYKYEDALKACDFLLLFKYITKKIASRYNYIASFMPKPINGQNGSGLHTNMSVNKDRKNVFADATNNQRVHFINGILANGKALAAFTNSSVNSYNRLTKGYEAPIYLSYSRANRSTMIRIPSNEGETARVEVRNVDAACNIYLTVYALIKAGMAGIDNKISKYTENEINVFKLTDAEVKEMGLEYLPQSLAEAIKHLGKNALVQSWFEPTFIATYSQVKFSEWTEYKKQVSHWEQAKYINC